MPIPDSSRVDEMMTRFSSELERHMGGRNGLFLNTRVMRAARGNTIPMAPAFEDLVCEQVPVHIPAPEPRKKRKIILDKG